MQHEEEEEQQQNGIWELRLYRAGEGNEESRKHVVQFVMQHVQCLVVAAIAVY